MSRRGFITEVPLINLMAESLFEASSAIVRDFSEITKSSFRGINTFVLKSQERAHTTLKRSLSKAFSDYGYVTQAEQPGQINDAGSVWHSDPLGNLVNFAYGIPHCSLSLALIKNGVGTAAVIYDPLRDELFWSHKDKGAFLYNVLQRLPSLPSRTMRLKTLILGGPESRVMAPEDYGQKCVREAPQGCQLLTRTMGCHALDLAYVACKRLDGTFVPLPHIAGEMILKAAGGYIVPSSLTESPGFWGFSRSLASILKVHDH